MHSPKTDFRQWIVYNSLLKDDHQLYALFKVLENGLSRGAFTCDRVSDGDAELYRITQQGNESTLLLSSRERADMLQYLKTHYVLGEDVEKWIAGADERNSARKEKNADDVPYFLDPRYNPSALSGANGIPATRSVAEPRQTLREARSTWFFHHVPRRHVLGYALIALLVVQVFIIPTNVFRVKLPTFLEYSYNLVYLVILHIAVRNYRNYFLEGGIRYGTVWAITFWLFFIVFSCIGIELGIIDSIKNGSFNVGFSLIVLAALIIAGLFVGWIFSLFVYFINGGKVVTDPSTIKAVR
ncbi:MAG TPA: hypothetical protein VGD65_00065 [Chryseosolibacter sp.]